MRSGTNSTSARRAACQNLVTTRGAISCIKYTRTSRGKYVENDFFDVPAEEYSDGNLTGYKIAAEFMRALENGDRKFDPLQIILGACKVAEDNEARGRSGAAVGFLRTLEEFIVFAAIHARGQQYIERKIERIEQWRRENAEEQKAERANFARRMEIAKAGKAHALRVIARVSTASSRDRDASSTTGRAMGAP